ncbi:uncharacterized protein LOC113323012 [Papaver somniferum]|uniref:uncharacterized protein LOC113323012 n=1 Tax=Papaver somniferum TaxID=3469 RepID=UPI000E70568F|nr:uncharacterized protein LOC113323012 [Papaver somniferum]
MRRPGQFSEPGLNSYVTSQMQHMSAQRMQQGSGTNHFSGRPDALPGDEEHPYVPSKPEGPWQSHAFEGQRGDAPRALYQGQNRLDSQSGLQKAVINDQRVQIHEQDTEIGYDESSHSQTFEVLENKFHGDIIKLTKEQDEAEDAENARHKEKIVEINARYHEKLTALRSQHASRREDFLRRESQGRQSHYKQLILDHFPNQTGPNDPRGYGGSATAVAAAEAAIGEGRRAYAAAEAAVGEGRRAYAAAEAAAGEGRRAYAAASQFDSYRERAQYLQEARNHGGFEPTARNPYPGGRAYNNNSRLY